MYMYYSINLDDTQVCVEIHTSIYDTYDTRRDL